MYDKPQEHAHLRARRTAIAHNLNIQPSPPGQAENREKDRGVRGSVSWGDTLNIRFNILEGNNNLDYEQPLLIHTETKLPKPNVYLMLSALAIDTSKKELLYSTHWTHPVPTNEIFLIDV